VKALLLINPRSGRGDPDAEELRTAAEARGIEGLLLGPDDDPAELARASDAEVVGVAGGDGSLAPVAEVALATGRPFVCVPFGTRNHFARDLGLDRRDPVAALDAFAGEERRIDVGRVGERAFLNNVSLGAYAALVHRRERHPRRRRLLARARAMLVVARGRHEPALLLEGAPLEARVVLVANNAYRLELFDLGERPSLTGGRLHLYTARGVMPTAWEERAAERLRLDSPDSVVAAAVDGEPAKLEPPLEFRIEPRALCVLLPPRG
jgi:diacylglycerol kinase family enzyme